MSSVKEIINLYFATHKTCNMNCRYCYVPEYNRFGKKENDNDILHSLEQFIIKVEDENYAIGSFCLHGSEPSLLSAEALGDAVNMVNEHWNKTGINGYDVAIQSNGKKLTESYLLEVLKKIGDSNKLRLGFSIDPPKDVHDFMRDNSFDEVVHNYYNAINLEFPVSVLSVISKNTMQDLPGFGEWMKEQLKKKAEKGNPYKVKIKFATGDSAVNENEIKLFTDFLINEDLLSLPQMFTPGYCIQNGNNCLWFEFDIYGNCYSCNKAYNNDGIFASWNTDLFDDIMQKRMILYHDVLRNQECFECPYEFLCNSGCPIDRYREGKMAGKAHECSMIKQVYGHILMNTDLHIIDFYNNN
ncbi:radical SAM protein [Bacteroidota bacterium]